MKVSHAVPPPLLALQPFATTLHLPCEKPKFRERSGPLIEYAEGRLGEIFAALGSLPLLFGDIASRDLC
jgi:hypothetical protein